MLSTPSNTTVIGKLRIRSKASDPQSERQRIGRMMRSAALHPASLPEPALLVVRRMADPLPSRLRAGPFDDQADPVWQRAVVTELENLCAKAARPALGPVPESANAVLFLDRAELLSSLALDWLAGTLTSRWWWREVLRGRDAVTALLQEWIEAPHYVPGALEILSRRAQAVPFVQRLPRRAVAEILDAVLRVYGVPRPNVEEIQIADIPPIVAKLASADSADSEKSAETVLSKPFRMDRMETQHSPWERWVPEASTPGLSQVQKILLIQTLMLRRAPASARTVAFQTSLQIWYARTELEAMGISLSQVQLKQDVSSAESYPNSTSAPEKVAAAEQIEPKLVIAESPTPVPLPPQAETKAAPTGNVSMPTPTPVPTAGSGKEPQADSACADRPEVSKNPDTIQPQQTAEPAPSVETEFGGIFFLLNVALYLNIYADFTTPAETGLELNIWDFLALISTRLSDAEIESDPLWRVLASLAGRTEEQPPGSAFDAPDEWRISPEWLKPFPEDFDPQPVLRDGRVICMHPAGFTVHDVPIADTEPSQSAGRLDRWVGWMADYFRARLVRALGREDAVELVFRLKARVTQTPAHVDVYYSLNLHPIEIRMAVLDRDPGWIPAAGRHLAFHFQ